jgi:hypothetical protein
MNGWDGSRKASRSWSQSHYFGNAARHPPLGKARNDEPDRPRFEPESGLAVPPRACIPGPAREKTWKRKPASRNPAGVARVKAEGRNPGLHGIYGALPRIPAYGARAPVARRGGEKCRPARRNAVTGPQPPPKGFSVKTHRSRHIAIGQRHPAARMRRSGIRAKAVASTGKLRITAFGPHPGYARRPDRRRSGCSPGWRAPMA